MTKDNNIISNIKNEISIIETLKIVMCTFFGVIPVGLFYGWAVLSYPIGILINNLNYYYYYYYYFNFIIIK